MLSNHLMTSGSSHSSSEDHAISHISGSCFSISLNKTSDPTYDWIIDSGASNMFALMQMQMCFFLYIIYQIPR